MHTDRKTRRLVMERDLGVCVRCGYTIYPGEPYSLQHRKPRRMGGSRDPLVHSAANLILVCGSATTGCHGYMEKNRNEAARNGWILHDGEDPDRAPVSTCQHGWVLLDTCGGFTPTGPPPWGNGF